MITIKIQDTEQVSSLVKAFLIKVKDAFGESLVRENIHQLNIKPSNSNKAIDLLQETDKHILQLPFLVNWTTVTVVLKHNTKYEFKRIIKNPANKIIIFKEHSQEFIT